MKGWPFLDPFWPLITSSVGPLDQTARFQPDVGPPITRRRTTARLDAWSMVVILKSYQQFDDFRQWFDDDTQAGALPFAWRDPIKRNVRRFKFSPATYETSFLGAEVVRVSFSVLALPGEPWFAPYVPDDSAWVPDWVADYDADRYWIGQEEVEASDLATISGSFLVLNDSGDWATVTYSGNVPQTAPSGVDWLAGFANAT